MESIESSDVARVVIAGAGQAATSVAKTLRAEGYAGEIVMLGAEPFLPYERPFLSKALLRCGEGEDVTWLLDERRIRELDLDLRIGTRVTEIDRRGQQVLLRHGESVAYDRLVIATGGRARRLYVVGNAGDRVSYLRTLDDARLLRDKLRVASSLLVVGGGWIGLEIASCARSLGVEVTLLEAGTRLCERTVPCTVSDRLLEVHRELGTSVHLGTQLESMSDIGDGRILARFGGREASFDLVVVGVGMTANDEIASAAGLPCAGGVLCDSSGRTEDPWVFACGDVAAYEHPLGPAGARRLESWENAGTHGRACARAILGKVDLNPDLPWFWSEQGKVNVQILGFPDANSIPITREHNGKTAWFWLSDHLITGAVFIDAPSELAVAKRLWQRRVRVDAHQLASPEVSLKSLLQTPQDTTAGGMR